MSCGCKNKVNKYVDVSKIESHPWNDAETILGLSPCGDMMVVDKPENEMTAEDREKLDSLVIEGDGGQFLADDGEYHELELKNIAGIRTKGRGKEFLADDGKYKPIDTDHIVYYEKGRIDTRGDVNLAADGKITGGQQGRHGRMWFDIVDSSRFGTLDVGSPLISLNIKSDSRPTVQVYGKNSMDDEKIAFLSDVEGLKEDIGGDLGDAEDSLNKRIDDLQGDLDSHVEEFNGFRGDVNGRFNEVDGQIDELRGEVAQNTSGIAQNKSDIAGLRADFNDAEHFKGYYETSTEIQGLAGELGAYAWSAESGTVWVYDDGVKSWRDSGRGIPDQTVEASDITPLVAGEAEVGTANKYARGDHRHPTDQSRASVSDLEGYLSLGGNTGETQITGDVWIKTGGSVLLNDSGNSYLKQDINSQTTVVRGEGAGGIDLISENSTVKYNGVEVATVGDLAGHEEKAAEYAAEMDGRFTDVHSEMEEIRGDVVVNAANIAINVAAIEGLRGNFSDHLEEFGTFGEEMDGRFVDVAEELGVIRENVADNRRDILINSSDIAGLRADFNDAEHFKGYYETSTEIQGLAGELGAYAWSAESGTVWVYDDGVKSWRDSGRGIPDQTVEASDITPLVAGEAEVGTANKYARGDHRHPTDQSRASASDLEGYLSLGGNTGETKMSGDIWLGTGNKLNISDSGNSFLVQDTNTQTSILCGEGGGGIDLVSESGTVKYNGVEVATVENVAEKASECLPLTGGVLKGDLGLDGGSVSMDSDQRISFSGETNVTIGYDSGSEEFRVDSGAATNGMNVLTGGKSSAMFKYNDVEVATVDDVAGLNADMTELMGGLNADLTGRMEELTSDLTGLVDGLNSGLTELVEELENKVDGHVEDFNGFRDAVNGEFVEVRADISRNAADISLTASDLESLQSRFNQTEKFKGYFQKDIEVQSIPGEEGAYAWSGESESVWIYNIDVMSWQKTKIPIPNGAISPFDTLPLMDGRAHAGTSNMYARGDHRHPTDETRAPLTELANYLKLEGNAQTDPMLGDIWMGGNKVILSESGGDFIGYEKDNQQSIFTTQNGMDIRTGGGKLQYNGLEVATLEDVDYQVSEFQKWRNGNAVALGGDASASANHTTALGSGSRAAAYGATALGHDAKSPAENATSVGMDSNAEAEGAIAVGAGAVASGVDSVAIGKEAYAEAEDSFAFGRGAEAKAQGVFAAGKGTMVSGDCSVGIGKEVRVWNVNSVAIGHSAVTSGQGAVAMGAGAGAAGANSVAIGKQATAMAENGVALGADVDAADEDIEATDTHGFVSVGKTEEFTRRIINVKDGVKDTDAATVGQVRLSGNSLLDALNTHIADYEAFVEETEENFAVVNAALSSFRTETTENFGKVEQAITALENNADVNIGAVRSALESHIADYDVFVGEMGDNFDSVGQKIDGVRSDVTDHVAEYKAFVDSTGSKFGNYYTKEETYTRAEVTGITNTLLPLAGGTVTGNLTVNGTLTGSLSGNAATADKLATPVKINDVEFNGTEDIEFGRLYPTKIEWGTDMDSLTANGMYYCDRNEIAVSLSNCPTEYAFSLLVEQHAGRKQTVSEFRTVIPKIYFRNWYPETGWSEWFRVYTTADEPTTVANADQATHAVSADTATRATNADLATRATAADLATRATTADLATTATQAMNATHADHAVSADTATRATNADLATRSTTADLATTASTATTANTAGKLTNAVTINGVSFDGSSDITIITGSNLTEYWVRLPLVMNEAEDPDISTFISWNSNVFSQIYTDRQEFTGTPLEWMQSHKIKYYHQSSTTMFGEAAASNFDAIIRASATQVNLALYPSFFMPTSQTQAVSAFWAIDVRIVSGSVTAGNCAVELFGYRMTSGINMIPGTIG